MLTQNPHPPAWQRAMQRIASTRPGAWLLAHTLHHADRVMLRLSGGEQTLSTLITGLKVVTLTTTGAKSGELRRVPVIPMPDGEKLVLMPTNFGQAHHPGWYYNLRAHPEATITYKGVKTVYTAREATPEEAQVYWPRAAQLYPGYGLYRQRAKNRQIPLFVLEPDHDEGGPAQQPQNSLPIIGR